ncbi:DNA repair protein RecN [Mycoplasmatota bacterium WC44]
MLESIHIKNFAIIDNTEIEFKNGLTVLTGETGAGKTIIIDAIGLLLGERASLDMIRHGESKAVLEGVFTFENPKVKEKLNEYGIESEEKIIIVRQLLASGKSTLRVNGTSVTLNVLKDITKYLIDIHLQHDTHRLFDPSNYVEILDNFNDNNLLENYQPNLKNYKELLKKYNSLINSNFEMNQQLDYLKFQKEELDEADLNITEELELIETQSKLENFDKIYQNVKDAYSYLYDSKAIDNIYTAFENVSKLKEYSEEYKKSSNALENIYYELEEVVTTLKKNVDYLDFDPEKLSKVQSRLNEINRLKRKYGKSVDDLINYLDELKSKINAFENKDEAIDKIINEVKASHQILEKNALEIHEKRKKIAHKLQNEITAHLEDLHLAKASFVVRFNEINLKDPLKDAPFLNNGVDEIDFLISTNIGEPLKPLSKTASGGEISRIMLALKTILLKSQKLSTIIFDEIDSGVSGVVAHSIAKKVKLVSKNTQVLLITHLPQVAAIADHHIFVKKHEINGRTISVSKYLPNAERIYEIAKMLSNEKVSDTALLNAKQLLNEYQ